MFVKNHMTYDPYCVQLDTTISEALDIMKKNNFHRLPVIQNNKLVGLITEGIIRANTPSQATSLSIYELNYLLSKMTVKEIMIKDVNTISPDALLEEAAMKMRQHDIACLPVIKNDFVLGIITQNDIFDAFIELSGYNADGQRYLLKVLEDHPGILKEITSIFQDQKANITSVSVYHEKEVLHVIIQANGGDQETIINQLANYPFEVTTIK